MSMNLLRYKDYQGSVRFEDGRLLIQILHIDDFITTECDSASAAQSAFEELVDDYIETCAELKKEPSKPFKGSLNVRMPPALHKRAAVAAAESGESINALITRALQTYLDRTAQREVEQADKEKLLVAWFSSQLHSMSQEHRSWETFATRSLVVPVQDIALPSSPTVRRFGRLQVVRARTSGLWTKRPGIGEVQ
jgi:predicted HicB family RNase H-like nuclease